MNNEFEKAKQASIEAFGRQQTFDDANTTTAQSQPEQQATPSAEQASSAQATGAIEQQEQPVQATDRATVTEEAISVAEQAAAIAQQKNSEVATLTQQLEQEKQKSASLEAVINEMNQKKEEEILEEPLTMPELQVEDILFASPEELAAAQKKYAEEMSEYQHKLLDRQYAPIKAQAKKLEEAEILQQMTSDVKGRREFEGFDSPEMQSRLRIIIEQNEFLKNSDLPYEKKLINAFAIARGADAMYSQQGANGENKEQSVDELVEIYKNNPEFKQAIEKLRIDELNDGQQVPPLTASGGAGNVALNINNKPKTFGEARERAKARLFH